MLALSALEFCQEHPLSLKALGSLLESAPQYQRLYEDLKRSRITARVQVSSNAVPFTLATLWQGIAVPTLVIAPRPEDARRLQDQLLLWSGQHAPVLHFPETETLPYERLVSDVGTVHQRLRTLSALAKADDDAPIVVTSAAALAQKTIDKEAFVSSRHTLRRGDLVNLSDLLDRWRRMGYLFEAGVYAPGTASRRGGILDIFPVGASLPTRIELWGNEIDSIRLFDPETQRSTDVVDSIDVIPAQETLSALTHRDHLDSLMAFVDLSNCSQAAQERIREELNLLLDGYEVEDLNFYAGFFNRGSLLDYFPGDGMLAMYRPTEIAEAAWETEERAHKLRQVKEQRGELPFNFPPPHLAWTQVEERAAEIGRRMDIMPWGADELIYKEVHVLPFTSPAAFLGRLGNFAAEADALAQEGHRVIAVTTHSGRLGEILAERGVRAELPKSLDKTPSPGSITVLQSEGGGLADGFVLSVKDQKLVVLSDSDIFGMAKQRRSTRRTAVRREAFLSELHPGDYVVHVEHGIGRFVGTGHMSSDKEGTEYLILQYAQGDKLYVPMEHLDRVITYIAPIDRPPSLTRLGSQEWRRTKERVARSTRVMAAELLSLYATRELVQGHAFPSDTPWQAELEESFPYEETPDQLTTLADVKADLESDKPSDRLVCGDVGYGKTEIAVRAAFKVVMDGKQVAVLVPTTVLAQQHYVTFSQRLSAYPTTIDVLSRFRTDAEQRQIVEGLASGRIDICIGTHRLIQKDVRFKDLGLVIIDEEQRFGVAHKERLKQMRREVDALTLTATPIPRTLHMSMAGVRDMSTIETPPEERLPIKTYVSEFSDELIREAILRELDRQGQVYFLHNRVHNIDYMAEYIQMMVPEATLGIGHGQMPESQLEQTMIDFAEGKMDVLVCTTIIESGLDIPNVNTLIINRADAFGLAQLYQLRGRVGRSARRAYAYLLIPKARSLTEAAEKRLKAMLAATELGAGFHIAMRDLEIRGAGNILGAEQSGHIHAVGFELYTRLLSNAVEELRARRAAGDGADQGDGDLSSAVGTAPEYQTAYDDALAPAPQPTIDLGIPASIPEEYIPDLPTRLGVYQRLVKLIDPDQSGDVDTMAEELRDRFGPLPWQAENVLYVLRLKLQAQRAEIESITRESERVVLRLKSEVGGARRALQRALGPGVEVGNTRIRLELDHFADGWEQQLADTVEKLANFMERVGAGVQAAAVTGRPGPVRSI